jgi:hypothetical protein
MESGGSFCVSEIQSMRGENLTHWELRNPVGSSEDHLYKFRSICFE